MRNTIYSFITILLVSFVLLSIQCQKKPVEQLVIEGNYKIDSEFLGGELEVKKLPDNKISFSAATVTKHPGQHLAAIDGEATLNGNVATYQDKDDPHCKLTITFHPNQAAIDGADTNCRYYMGASAVMDGTYNKSTTK